MTRIQSVHFDADAKLVQFIEDRLTKFGKFIGSPAAEAKVVLKLEKTGQVQDKVVELIINLPGHPLIAKSTRKSFEEAVRDAINTLKVQWSRYKEKLQAKH